MATMTTTREHDLADYVVYSEWLCFMSVCSRLDQGALVMRMEEHGYLIASPTHTWRLADGPFKTGEPNPCPCNDFPDRRQHFLFSC